MKRKEKLELTSLYCPGCGASLEVEDGLDVFYCKYCGHRIILTGRDEGVYKAKVKYKEFEHKERAQKAQIEYEREQRNAEREQKRYLEKEKIKERKHKSFLDFLSRDAALLLYLLIIGGIVGYFFLGHYTDIRKLEKIEAQVEQDISDKDYDSALLHTNQLLYKSDIWENDVKIWREKRNNYLEIIKQKQIEEAKNNPDIIFAPFDEYKAHDNNYIDVANILKEAGFTNIRYVKQTDNSWLFHHEKDAVRSISIAGNDDFTTENYFEKDSEVTIYFQGENGG